MTHHAALQVEQPFSGPKKTHGVTSVLPMLQLYRNPSYQSCTLKTWWWPRREQQASLLRACAGVGSGPRTHSRQTDM